jgi:hypothetical protein
MGKIERTIFLIHYVSDPAFRRRIHRGLNSVLFSPYGTILLLICWARGSILTVYKMTNLKKLYYTKNIRNLSELRYGVEHEPVRLREADDQD